jgi:hypothetical protein
MLFGGGERLSAESTVGAALGHLGIRDRLAVAGEPGLAKLRHAQGDVLRHDAA